MTEELKPCPFCGCNADIVPSEYRKLVVRCQNCSAESATRKTEAEAVEEWNTRAESEVYGHGWAVKTKWNSVPHIFHDQRDAERFAYDEKSEAIKVRFVRDKE